jgi:transcriptional regulator with XRE-family HTH domain
MSIKRKLLEQNLTVSALEKKAGIRPSSLQNIIQGRSKNPNLDTLKTVAKALECSVSDLLEEDRISADIELFLGKNAWNQDRYFDIISSVISVCRKSKRILPKKVFLLAVEEIYDYALRYSKNNVDQDLIDWVLQRLSKDK